MYKETLRAFEGRKNGPLFYSVVVFFILVCIIILSNFLYSRFHSSLISYGTYVLFGIIGYYVYKMKIIEYRYSLMDDEILIEQIVGDRQKPIVSVKVRDILYLGPVAQGTQYKGKADRNYRCHFSWNSDGIYVMVAKRDGEIIRILFKPSGTLVEMLKKYRR